MERDKRIFAGGFSIPGASLAIEEFYKREVILRGRNYIEDHELKESLQKTGTWLEDQYKTPGLLIGGIPGDGKTTTLRAIKTLISMCKQMDPDDHDYYGQPSLACLQIHKASDIKHYIADNQQFLKLKKTSLLAIDDLGTESVEVQLYGNIYYPIIELLEYRYDNQMFTILTSNIRSIDIRKWYGDRIADRFSEMMTCVAYPDISFRQIKTDR